MKASGAATPDDITEVLGVYRDPRPRQPPDWEEEEGVEAYLRDPPDPGPLAQLQNRGWIDEETAAKVRLPIPDLKRLLNLPDDDVVSDIQENAIHIIGRCNNPNDWGENRTGLVYGMVQSGKTASMISVMEIARSLGYRLFIILAGDKSSLRDQTQNRVNSAFGLQNGINLRDFVYSPTWDADFRNTRGGYTGNFRYRQRIARDQDWTIIIVVKKNKYHLQELIQQIKSLEGQMGRDGYDFEATFPAIILDDESDYASPNTDVYGTGNTIHNKIVGLRNALPRNTYVGYTATPQACLSANPNDIVGYPKDFFWLLEPYMEKEDGVYRPRTYLGAWEVFWTFDTWLIRRIARDDWPHYEKDRRGKSLGIYMPPYPRETEGSFEDARRTHLDQVFLADILAERRPMPQFLTNALLDFLIACAIRWWRHWRQSRETELPSMDAIGRAYPHVAAMVHLSETQENQGKVRELVQREWRQVVSLRQSFNPETSPPDHPLRRRLVAQAERTRELTQQLVPHFSDLAWFIDRCIELVERPINNHRELPYRPYSGKPFVYLLNSSDQGMELFYGRDDPPEIQTKRAAIFVGGNILSRGLTIEGLAVTVFGRASKMPLGDATLQMGRWFGHKQSLIDLVSLYLQEDIQEVLAQVAEADRYLRLQIKDAIIHGHSPTQVLLEMKNSAFFRITSPTKSKFLQKDQGLGFAGQTALLNEPSFDVRDITENRRTLERFQGKHTGGRVHNRATLYRDVDPWAAVELLKSMRCPDEASQVSFKQYAKYLEDWLAGSGLPPFPQVHVAVMDGTQRRRRRITTASRPTSPEEARATVTGRFGPIVGGRSGDGRYKGDAFLDKNQQWHVETESPSKERGAGDDILIVFYRLDPNYVTKKILDKANGKWLTQEVRLQQGDPYHVALHGYADADLPAITFAAWTPAGGPMYGLATHSLIDVGDIKQRGRVQLGGETDESEE